MLTSLGGDATAPAVRDDRQPFRPFRVTVAAVRRTGQHFTRVTFTGPDLHLFGRDGLDQRIKLYFPLPGVGVSDFGVDDERCHLSGDWYARWRALPDAVRNPMRTYTIRATRPQLREIDVDFVVHEPDAAGRLGPAGRWLLTAAPGNELVIVGPDVRSLHSAAGIDWQPGGATRLLLVGDDTAVPAVCNILESLPPGSRVAALVELTDVRDAPLLTCVAETDVRWLQRDPAGPGVALEAAVRGWIADEPALMAAASAAAPQELEDVDVDTDQLWESPSPVGTGFYAWLAGEADIIKRLRRLLVTDSGVDRSRVAFMGYWRRGRAEAS